MVKEHSQFGVALMGIIDLAVTAGAWIVSFHLRFHWGLLPVYHNPPQHLAYLDSTLVLTLLLALLVFSWLGMYRPRRMQTFGAELWDILRACALVWLVEVALSHFLYRPPAPRISIGLQLVYLGVWPLLLVVWRGTLRGLLHWSRSRGYNQRSAAIIGTGRLGQRLLHALRGERWTGYRVLYLVEDHRIGEQFLGVPVRGPIEDIDRLVDQYPVDCVFVALPQTRAPQIAEVLGKLATEPVDVNVVPDLLSYQFLNHRVLQIGELPLVNLTDSPQRGVRGLLKRALDLVGAAAVLLLASPLLLAVALAVKLTSPGPLFYRQRRASLGGREFDLIKFRSMVHHADRHNGHEWSTDPADPRITPVGRVIRRLSLDELPQLINVLRGDMSLVGPRPELPQFIRRFSRQVPRYALRHHVKAGLTGWAQVNGYRGRTSLRKRIQYDLDYIHRWSLGFDLRILLLTAVRGFYDGGRKTPRRPEPAQMEMEREAFAVPVGEAEGEQG